MNRPTHPRNPAGGWQATPGQPIPRAARQPAANGLLLVILLLVWISPLSILVWLVGQAVILLQRRWHWWRFTLAALGGIALVLVISGPEEALRRHVFVPQHFWQYVALHFGFGPPGTRITISQFLWDLLATQVWLAVPVGLLAASLSVWNAERAAGGAEWSPFVRRRQRIDQRTRDRKTARLVARPRDDKLTTPALGVALDGDLRSWRQGRYVVPPAQLRGKAMAVVGAPGAGKTVTLLRLAYLAGLLGRKVCFVDCKGTDPTLVPALIAAYRLGNPSRPGRLLAGHRHGHVARHAQSRWPAACSRSSSSPNPSTSGSPPPASAWPSPPPTCPRSTARDELLRRLDVDELAALWEGRPLQLKDIEAIGDHLPGARLRYADFFAALAGAFDRGAGSSRTSIWPSSPSPPCCPRARRMRPCGWCWRTTATTPPAANPERARTPCSSWTSSRALASGVDSAINLAERVRDVGVQVVVAAQSVEGLGDHRQAPRLLASCAGGIVVHQCPDPERLLALAGMVRTLEHNWELDHYGPRGFAKARMGDRPRIDPEAVRQAQPGEAWVIQAGQSIHLRVLPPPAIAPAPVEPAATLPLADDTVPLPTVEEPAPGRDRGRSLPWPGESCGGPDSSRTAAGADGAAAYPGRAAVAGRAAPAGSGAAMRPPAGTGLACGAARGNPAPARGPAGCLLDGLPPGRRPRQGRFASLRDGLRPALDPAVVQAARRDPVARGGRGAAPDQQAGGEDRGGPAPGTPTPAGTC